MHLYSFAVDRVHEPVLRDPGHQDQQVQGQIGASKFNFQPFVDL